MSSVSVGIIGLPNVGKSTLFNALLKKQTALVANYPFATIEPNVGVVPVPDERLTKLSEIEKEEHKMVNLPPIVSATVSFVDIAGLVKGASEGEGLGNKFLSHIREVDAIAHVVRYFQDENVHHVSGAPEPKSDKEVIEAELILADLQTLEKQQAPKMNASKEDGYRWSGVQKLRRELNEGTLAKEVQLTDEELVAVKQLQLLTMKPMFYIANVSEEQLSEGEKLLGEIASSLNVPRNDVIMISGRIEQEVSELPEEDQKEYLNSLGLEKSGLEKVIQKGYEILNLISFLTAGEKEVRAWTIKKGSTALEAAGEIHTDFMKAFIKAEVVPYDDFIQNNGWKGSRDAGRAKLEGKDYVMQDGDVVEFKIGSMQK